MSQENVDVVRKLYESRGSEFFELLDPYVIWINYASAPETRPYVGHEGVREWVKGFRDTFGDYQMEATKIIDAGGDQVVAANRMIGAGTTSRVPVEREFATLFTLVNGRIVRVQGFDTRDEALEAAGLRP